jgi:hypothetical protein
MISRTLKDRRAAAADNGGEMDYEIARSMIEKDLADAGFQTAINMHGAIRVGLASRKIFPAEVRAALDHAGYDESQYETNSVFGYILVWPVVG